MKHVFQEDLYTFHTDIYIEKPFLHEIVSKFNGKLDKYMVNGNDAYKCKCPTCGNPAAKLIKAKTKDTYGLICPQDGCTRPYIVLHDLVKEFGGKVMFDKWRNARWEKRLPHGWKPIKNRRVKC